MSPDQLVSGGQELAAPLQIALFLSALAFLSSALVTLTAFTRIVIVLSFARRALSTQEIPPTPVLLGLALFLTLFVMGPTFEAIDQNALTPYMDKELSAPQACELAWAELRQFMIRQTRKSDLQLFLDLAKSEPPETAADIPARVLVPAFVTSELKTAFIMGFCLYVPFLLIDLVVSVVLMSLGMMMMPPVIISTPLKLLLFVLVDGWPVLLRALTTSFH
ncbi:MAG: flagellar type III secretion system pore protein FliP [Planctomyces sp.]|nr:flagellar type III secretion system pore protein FliP [Planctomyces sp.]